MSTRQGQADLDKHIDKLVENKDALPAQAQEDLSKNIEAYRRLIHKMARKYVRNRVEYEDLVQEAFIGLVLACRGYDPARSEDFHTYAIYRMKGKMYEYCIRNENPIHVPTHVAKAASYVKQMQRLLDKEPAFTDCPNTVQEIIAAEQSEWENKLSPSVLENLKELKRKLGNIALNSKMDYEKLAGMAMESLSLVVSDDILSKFPKETDLVDELVSNRELSQQLQESLGEKRFMVLSMRALGWHLREIAEHLAERGYRNRDGEQISRQAVKGILDETIRALEKMRIFRDLHGLFQDLREKGKDKEQ